MYVQNPTADTTAIAKPAHIHAPAESVDQFRALLAGMNNSFESSNPVLSQEQKPSAQTAGSLLEDTSLRLHKTEVAMEELNWEIRKAGQDLGKAMPMSGQLPAQISYMKYATTAYFTNLMRAESGFGSLSEEIQALTKKRG
mgnify:FL=1